MKKSQINTEHYNLIESIIKDSPLYDGHEKLLDAFIETIYKKSYLLIDSIHDADRLKKHLITICDDSIEQVLQNNRTKEEEESETENYQSEENDLFKESANIVFNNNNNNIPTSELEDPIEKHPPEKIKAKQIEKLINSIQLLDSEYPNKDFYKIFTLRYINKYDLTETAKQMNISQTELTERLAELIDRIEKPV